LKLLFLETLVKSQTSQDTIENSIDKEVFDSPNKKSIAYSGDMHFVKPGVTDYSHDVQTIIFLLKEHSKNTKSSVSQQLLQSLPECLCRFSKIVPKQKKHVLKKIIIDYIFRIDNPDTATLFDDWDDMPVQSFPEESVQFSSPLASFYNYKYQRCERLRRRMESLNIHEDPQSMSHSCLPPLHQYITDLKDYYKDFDLLSDTHKKQFHRLMKEGRMMYSYVSHLTKELTKINHSLFL
jgi:glutamate synthase domain-containing protein 3